MAEMIKSQEILLTEMRTTEESLVADIAKLLDERRLPSSASEAPPAFLSRS
jgi:hypothetical protein